MRSPETLRSIEQEKPPSTIKILLARHANRTPSGELTPEGIKRATEIGSVLNTTESHKTYSSPEERAIDTAAIIEAFAARPPAEISERISQPEMQDYMAKRTTINRLTAGGNVPPPGKRGVGFGEREFENLYYNAIINPEIIKGLTQKISQATLEKWQQTHSEIDSELARRILFKEGISDLDPSQQTRLNEIRPEISSLREELQYIGINELVEDLPEESHKLAMATAKNLVFVVNDVMKSPGQPARTALVVTHAGFANALFKEALIREYPDGEKVEGFKKQKEIGGHTNPVEIYQLDVSLDDQGKVKRANLKFDDERKRKANLENAKISLDWEKVEKLAAEFEHLTTSKPT